MKFDRTFDSYTFFGSLPWNHVWERQQELISRFSAIIDRDIVSCKPLGMINYNLLSGVFWSKIFKRRKEASEVGMQNPRPMNLVDGGSFAIPWHNRLLGKINYLLLRKKMLMSDNNFFWATYANYTIYEFFKRSKFKVYDIAERRSQNPAIPDYVKRLERKMVAEADIVFIDNHAAIEDYKDLNSNIYYVPQGVNIEMFESKSDTEKKYVGYIGNFHFAIDYDFLSKFINLNSDQQFLLVGGIMDERALPIMALPNVIHIDTVAKSELGNHLSQMKYGLIPYAINEVTIGVYPTKMFEYIAAGVPVISTPLPEVLQYADDDCIKIIDSPVELNFDFTMAKCDQLLKNNTWDARWSVYIKEINKCLKK